MKQEHSRDVVMNLNDYDWNDLNGPQMVLRQAFDVHGTLCCYVYEMAAILVRG